MPWSKHNPDFFGSVTVLEKNLVKLPQYVCTGVHSRPDIEVEQFLDSADQCCFVVDMIRRVGWRRESQERSKLALVVFVQYSLGTGVDLPDQHLEACIKIGGDGQQPTATMRLSSWHGHSC